MTVGGYFWSRRGDARRVALAFAVLAAFLLQNFVTATHVHNPASVAAAASAFAGHDGAKQPAHPRTPTEPANCPICHAVAQSGNFLTPAPIVFVAATSAATWLYAAAFGDPALSGRSHAWQSRAPPA